MTVPEIAAAVEADVVAPGNGAEILAGYTSDLLSDVVANAPPASILVTIQAHRNTVAVATLAGIRAILVCNNRRIPAEMIAAAETEGIALLSTRLNQFVTSHRIHARLFSS